MRTFAPSTRCVAATSPGSDRLQENRGPVQDVNACSYVDGPDNRSPRLGVNRQGREPQLRARAKRRRPESLRSRRGRDHRDRRAIVQHSAKGRSVRHMAVRSWLALLVFIPACALIGPPVPPPTGSPSADRFAPGPFAVASRDYTFVDSSRPSPADHAPRRLVTTVWFPVDAPGSHPLVLYSHGFLGNRFGGRYLAKYLASRGYVVAAPDHPFTRRWAPGGSRVEDVVNQPADLQLVMDRLLGWDASDRPFLGAIDPARIGVMGLSLGGMTATMIAFDPQRRDPRIAAAVSIAGPLALFGPPYFAGPPVPFLMIAGDADVVIDYAANAPLAIERVPGGTLVSIAGASHVGFDDTATGIPRLFGNPDRFACWWLKLTLDVELGAALLAGLDEETASGTLLPAAMPLPCRESAACGAMSAKRQHAITTLAVGAFFNSRLSADPTIRARAACYLAHDIAHDFPEVRYASAPPRRAAGESQEEGRACSSGLVTRPAGRVLRRTPLRSRGGSVR
jgi:predicted dienelactone hydrolase